jgi:hypothetical protein
MMVSHSRSWFGARAAWFGAIAITLSISVPLGFKGTQQEAKSPLPHSGHASCPCRGARLQQEAPAGDQVDAVV